MDPTVLTDAELVAAYESECAMAAAFYDAGLEDAQDAADERVDRLVAELQRRGIA